jgi:TRAP-type C4-dicarboxylate transport system substrate-binding protein
MFGDSKAGIRAFDKWYRKHAATEMKDVKYCFGFILDPVRLHTRNKKVVVPGDIKGMKVRPSQATFATWVTLLGGTNVTSGPSEAADLLSKGVADAVTFPWGSVTLLGADKVTKYHLDIPLATATFQWIMNPKTYASMSAAQKKVIDDHCTTDWAVKFAGPWVEYEAAGISKVKALEGHETYSATPEQVAEWKKSAEPLNKQWADGVRKVGGDPDTIMKELRTEIDQNKASY